MNIKSLLKRSSLLCGISTWIKDCLQESQTSRSLTYYRAEATKKGLRVLEGDKLVTAVRQRLASRGIQPLPKPKGNLHIFLAFSLSNWEYVFPIALKAFGKVSIFEWRSLGFDSLSTNWLKVRNDMNREMLNAFKKAYSEQPIDAVFGYLSGYTVSPKTLNEMAKMGSVILNFSWDDKLHFKKGKFGGYDRGLKDIVSSIDLNLTNAPDSCIKYIVEGGLCMFWPEAAHPEIQRPYDTPFEFDVSFVGKKYGWRPRFIEYLRKNGIEVSTFGAGWENGSLSSKEMIKLYSRSKINLGFAGVAQSKRLMCLKGRDFEIPMSGGLYLTQDNPELGLVYDVGREVLTYHNEKDCVEKIRYLLNHPEEAARIRKAGRERALMYHTWEKRFEEVFDIVGLLKKE